MQERSCGLAAHQGDLQSCTQQFDSQVISPSQADDLSRARIDDRSHIQSALALRKARDVRRLGLIARQTATGPIPAHDLTEFIAEYEVSASPMSRWPPIGSGWMPLNVASRRSLAARDYIARSAHLSLAGW